MDRSVIVVPAASVAGYHLDGKRLLELGAGPGLPALFAAQLGCHSIITDLPRVVPLIERNIEANNLRASARVGMLALCMMSAHEVGNAPFKLCGCRDLCHCPCSRLLLKP